MRACLLLLLLVLTSPLAWGVPQQPTEPPARLPASVPSFIKNRIDPEHHILTEGDVLEFYIDIFREGPKTSTEITRNFTVRADGNVELPVVGEIRVAGQTIKKLEQIIDQKLRRKLRQPKFRLGIVSVAPVQILVLGEVEKPGRYDIAPGSGIPEALAAAGGFTALADRQAVVIQSGATNTTYPMVPPTDPSYRPFALRTSDVIVVNTGKKINVLGEVFKPGTYALPAATGGPLEALQAAGGAKPTSALPRAIVFRPGTSQSIPVNLAGTPNIPPEAKIMQEGDILIVPPRQAVVITTSPKAVPLIGGENIMDVVTTAGISVEYSLDSVRLIRSGTNTAEQIDLNKYLETQDRSILVPINDGDLIVIDVPRQNQGGVGNIMTNLGLMLLNPLNILQILRR